LNQSPATPTTRHRTWLILTGVTLLAFVLRLTFVYLTGMADRVVNADGHAYGLIATNLLGGHGFALQPGLPTAQRPFAYPWLLAGIFSLSGISVVAVQWVQALLGSLVVLPTGALAYRLGGPAVAALAGLAVAVHPVLIYLTALLAPDGVAMFGEFLLLWLALQIASGPRRRRRLTLAATVVAALTILLRPELLLVVVLLPVAVGLAYGWRTPALRWVGAVTVLSLVLALVPVTIRNLVVFDAFIPLPAVGGITFWGGNNAAGSGGWVRPLPAAWPDDDPPPTGSMTWPQLSEQESQVRFYRTAWAWIESHPADFARLLGQKLLRSWTLSFADEAQAGGLPPWVTWLQTVFAAVIMVGMVLALRVRPAAPVTWLLLVPVMAWIAKTLVFYGSARQTALVLPALCVFAALALGRAWKAVIETHPL
jgi:hypothetical protein